MKYVLYVRSSEAIPLNQWHWVKISRTGLEGILELNDKVVAVGHSKGAFTQLTLTQNLFIGGHRNFDETSKLANISQSFDGCIQKVSSRVMQSDRGSSGTNFLVSS